MPEMCSAVRSPISQCLGYGAQAFLGDFCWQLWVEVLCWIPVWNIQEAIKKNLGDPPLCFSSSSEDTEKSAMFFLPFRVFLCFLVVSCPGSLVARGRSWEE